MKDIIIVASLLAFSLIVGCTVGYIDGGSVENHLLGFKATDQHGDTNYVCNATNTELKREHK